MKNLSLIFQLIITTFVVAILISPISGKDAADNPLYIDPATRDFSENPALLERIFSGPHGYFRFINIPFSQEICRRFGTALAQMPSLNLHGDAHIEQYAITDLGRGLTDYDDASSGPGILDLMRFGVSMQLAAKANGWADQSDMLMETFLTGYQSALENPDNNAAIPALVKRTQAKFTIDREGYFKWVSSIMEPMSDEVRDSLITAIDPYIETKLLEAPHVTRNYFQITSCGFLRMGIGSALDMKFLVRIRGNTDDPMDDVVLEFKEVRDLSEINCIDSGREKDPFRILLGQTRIAYSPFKHLGYFRFRDRNFWVHSWVDNYKEADIKKSFESVDEMKEVAYDVGVQLGKGHVKHIATPFDLQLRREQLQLLKNHQASIIAACKELTGQTVAAWEAFCKVMKGN